MAVDFALSDPLPVYGIIGGIAVVAVILFVLYLRKKRQDGQSHEKSPGYKAGRLAYQPEARPVPAVPPGAIPRPARKTPSLPSPKTVSLIDGRADITESLHALIEKYSLDRFTIATSDGLVFASSGEEDAQTDAAQYGGIYKTNPLAETPGAVLTGISHKGSDLVLIIRTPLPVPDEIRQSIENDTKDILNWWI